jgi:hypothetical protein
MIFHVLNVVIVNILLFYYRTKINARRECWFLIDSKWLDAWADFVEGKEGSEPPGKLSTSELHDVEGKILPGLKPKIDYR